MRRGRLNLTFAPVWMVGNARRAITSLLCDIHGKVVVVLGVVVGLLAILGHIDLTVLLDGFDHAIVGSYR